MSDLNLKAGDIILSENIGRVLDSFCEDKRKEGYTVEFRHFFLEKMKLYAIIYINGKPIALPLPNGWKIHHAKRH